MTEVLIHPVLISPKPLAKTPNSRSGANYLWRRLLVWVILFTAWEGAYRSIGWKAWKFPAPSHVVEE